MISKKDTNILQDPPLDKLVYYSRNEEYDLIHKQKCTYRKKYLDNHNGNH